MKRSPYLFLPEATFLGLPEACFHYTREGVIPSVRLSVCLSVCPHKWKSEYSDLSTSWQLFFNIRLKKWRVEESNLLVTDLYHIHNYLHYSTNNTFSEYPQICFLILPNNMKCEKNFGEGGGLVKFTYITFTGKARYRGRPALYFAHQALSTI